MFPLKEKKIIRGAKEHIAAGLSAATDYVADYVPLYAPYDGTIETYQGVQGGNWLRLIRPNGDQLEFAHLSKYIKIGSVKEGEQIAVTGNTGMITTGPHLHLQIFVDGVRVDPEHYMNPFKLCIVNLDVKDTHLAQLPVALKTQVARISNGTFPLEVTIISVPRTDALSNLDPATAGQDIGLQLPYIRSSVDLGAIQGYQTTAVVYHWDGHNPNLNIRPRSHWEAYKGMQLCESWFWQTGDINQDPTAGWVWAIIHELCHTVSFRLRALGINEPDTTHNGNMGDFSDEFKIFGKYITQLTGGVTPPTIMTEEDVKLVYAVAFYRGPTMEELNYWKGKPLVVFLKTAAKDRAAFLNSQAQ